MKDLQKYIQNKNVWQTDNPLHVVNIRVKSDIYSNIFKTLIRKRGEPLSKATEKILEIDMSGTRTIERIFSDDTILVEESKVALDRPESTTMHILGTKYFLKENYSPKKVNEHSINQNTNCQAISSQD